MLRKRFITALWGGLLLIAAAWFDEPLPWFTVVAAVWGLLAVFEFYRITGVGKVRTLAVFGLAWTLFFILSRDAGLISLLQPHLDPGLLTPLLLTSAVVLSLILLVFTPREKGSLADWAWAIAGILYVGWLLGYLVELRGMADGRGWLFLALFATFGSDTAAFFAGRALGRHRLAPHISPGKTWEGAVAGLAGAVIVSLLFTLPTPLRLPLGYGQAVLLGVLVSVFGQIGDLAESLLKRHTGVKESGNMMPGHGGVLDRMDSVIFAGIVVYLYYIFVVG
jgi:phosphatidate cytidylyltransferase